MRVPADKNQDLLAVRGTPQTKLDGDELQTSRVKNERISVRVWHVVAAFLNLVHASDFPFLTRNVFHPTPPSFG